jgi:hypothetical protein
MSNTQMAVTPYFPTSLSLMIPVKNRQMILTDLHLMEWGGDSDKGGPMEVEDPELGLKEHDNKPGLE